MLMCTLTLETTATTEHYKQPDLAHIPIMLAQGQYLPSQYGCALNVEKSIKMHDLKIWTRATRDTQTANAICLKMSYVSQQ